MTDLETQLFRKDDAAGLKKAADILKNGGLVAIPTETVYGLAANALDGAAVAKIFKAKGRPMDNPLIVHIGKFDEIYPLVRSVPEKAKALAEQFDFIYITVGFHPENLDNIPSDYLQKITDFLRYEKAVAIGEIGLDYHWDIDKELQKRIFEEQLKLSKELDIPVVVHDREAHKDTLDLLKKYNPKGLLHCFSGSVEMLKEVLKLGMSISLGGTVTFKNARVPVEVAKFVPLDKLLLETDAPYLSPVPFRGKRNDSSMIAYTAEKIAEIKEGDLVLTYDKPNTKFVKVKKLEQKEGDFDFLKFKLKSVDDEEKSKEISVTEQHIMITLNKEGTESTLIQAKDVKVGQFFWTEDGMFVVAEIEREKGNIKYNLSVEDGAVFADGVYVSSVCIDELNHVKAINPATKEVKYYGEKF